MKNGNMKGTIKAIKKITKKKWGHAGKKKSSGQKKS